MAVRALKPESIHTLKIALWTLSITSLLWAWRIGIEDGLKASVPFLLFTVAYSPLTYDRIDKMLKRSGHVYAGVLSLAFAVIFHGFVVSVTTNTYTPPPPPPAEMSGEEIRDLKVRCEISADLYLEYYGDCLNEGKAEWEKENR